MRTASGIGSSTTTASGIGSATATASGTGSATATASFSHNGSAFTATQIATHQWTAVTTKDFSATELLSASVPRRKSSTNRGREPGAGQTFAVSATLLPPTSAPRVSVCRGTAELVLSFEVTGSSLVIPIASAKTSALVLSVSVTSCHSLRSDVGDVAMATWSAPTAAALRTVESSFVQNMILQGKRLNMIVGPLPAQLDATGDILLSISFRTASSVMTPPAVEGLRWSTSAALNRSAVGTAGSTLDKLPDVSIRFTAAPTAVDPQAVTAAQSGVAAVTVATVVVASPALASSAQRQALLSNVANCPNPIDPTQNTLGVSSHPLQFPLGSSLVRYYVGSMVGDFALMVGVTAAHAALTLAVSFKRDISFERACWRTRFPSQVAPAVLVLSQPALSGALVTLFYSDEPEWNAAAAVVLVLSSMWLGAAVFVVMRQQRAGARFVSKSIQRYFESCEMKRVSARAETARRVDSLRRAADGMPPSLRLERAQMSAAGFMLSKKTRTYSIVERTHVRGSKVRAAVQAWSRSQGIWSPTLTPTALCCFGPLFEETQPHGYYMLLLDQFQNLVSVAILSYIPDTREGCTYQFFAVLVTLTSYTVILYTVRPYVSQAANSVTFVIAALQAIAAWVLFVAFQLDSPAWMVAYSAINMATMAAQCVLVVHGAVKFVVEIRTERDALSRSLLFWTLLDPRGLSYFDYFHNDKALAKEPRVDALLSDRLHRSEPQSKLFAVDLTRTPAPVADLPDMLQEPAWDHQTDVSDEDTNDGTNIVLLEKALSTAPSALPASDAADHLLSYLESANTAAYTDRADLL